MLPSCSCASAWTVLQVAVLDEVQMLGDKGRGWSWTRVLLGLPAAQLHLCGDPAAADLLGQLATSCGDQLTVKRYRCAVLVWAILPSNTVTMCSADTMLSVDKVAITIVPQQQQHCCLRCAAIPCRQ